MSDWELAVIGSVLSDPKMMVEAETLLPSDFTGDLSTVWAETLVLHRNHALDLQALLMILVEKKIGDPEQIRRSLEMRLRNITQAVLEVQNAAIKKGIKKAAALIAVEADNDQKEAAELIEYAESKILALRRDRAAGQSLGDILAIFMPRIDAIRDGSFKPAFAPRTLAVRGMLPYAEDTELMLVAGRPGHGKSSWIRWEFYHLIRSAKPCLIFNYDNDPLDYARWFVAMASGIDTEKLKKANLLTSGEMDALREAAKMLQNVPLYIQSDRGDARWIYRTTQRYILEKHVQVVAVDYVQQVNNEKENENANISETMATLRSINQHFHVPILAASQMNREVERRNGGGGGKPLLSDLRASGSLEQDASVVIYPTLLWSDPTEPQMLQYPENRNPLTGRAYANPKAVPIQFHISKNRNGPVGASPHVKWVKSTNTYCDETSAEAQADTR